MEWAGDFLLPICFWHRGKSLSIHYIKALCPVPELLHRSLHTMTSPGLFIGMDEAGYGPNLGPLLIAATRWETPCAPQECDFYGLLAKAVSSTGPFKASQLHIADSKVVNTGKNGFRSLETSALALLKCLGHEVKDLQELCEAVLTPVALQQWKECSRAPWYSEEALLPTVACGDQIARLADQLSEEMERAGVTLTGVSVDLVRESRFNELCQLPGSNKAMALSRLAFQLLRDVWTPEETRPVLMVGDKHGGRNRYDDLLSEVLDGAMIFRLEESSRISRYRVQQSEFRFQVGGEAHLPVACASIFAKYLRELSMKQFNQFWGRHCIDVKPTLGYPMDARRFRSDVDAMRVQLGIEEHNFWRLK